MVYAHCLDYRSLNHMPQWFERTDLSFLLDLEGLTEKRLLAALDYLEGLPAEAWQQEMFESVCRHYRLRPGEWFMTSPTPISTQKLLAGQAGKR